jgi:putative ABC transport system permease protein
MLQDLRYALRVLAKSPAFTAVAVLALALGIGANTTIFSVVNAVLLKPLPYRDAGRLVLVRERIPQFSSEFFSVSAPDVLDIAKNSRTLDAVGAFQGKIMNLAAGGEPVRLQGARISANLIPMLGIAPALGRAFTAEEDKPGSRVMLLSYGLWRDRFGADPSAVGRQVLLDGKPYTIRGVMPRQFIFPPRGAPNVSANSSEFWVPMAFTNQELSDVVDNFDIGVIGHIRAGVTRGRVDADLKAVAATIEQKYPEAYATRFTLDIAATPLAEIVSGPARPLLLMLLCAVALVLAIACADVANLLLSRAASRRQEMAIRSALGAGRARILRQVLTESLLLAAMGGALGIALAWLGLDAFVAVLPASIPHSSEIALDLRVLGFAAAISLLTGLVFGSAPALSGWRGSVAAALHEAGRGSTAGAARQRLKNALVVAEIAISLVLLMGAGLFVRSYAGALSTDPGFRPQQVLAFAVSLPESQYPSRQQVQGFYHALNRKLEAIPGVRLAGAGNFLPLRGAYSIRTFLPEGWNDANGKIPHNVYSPVYGNFLQALGVPLVRGRYFTPDDRHDTLPVVIVSQSLARRYWPGQDALGKRLRFGSPDDAPHWVTIVGVVADVKDSKMEAEPAPESYQPVEQTEGDSGARSMIFAVRTDSPLAAASSAVRAAVASLDRTLPVSKLSSMQAVVDDSLQPRRFSTLLVGLFAALALFLALLGVYGVISFAVAQRTQEIGIRVALGAGTREVVGMFLREGLLLALAGIAVGCAAALLLARSIAGLLYGVQPTDAATLAVAAAVLAATALVATYIPARRALRLDPMTALRRQ